MVAMADRKLLAAVVERLQEQTMAMRVRIALLAKREAMTPEAFDQEIRSLNQQEEEAELWKDERDKEVERLQAIVDALPTCWRLDKSGDEPKLVQDEPVVPLKRVWLDCETAGYHGQPPGKAVEACVVHVDTPGTPMKIQFHSGEEWHILPGRVFDSREAAEHAAEAAKGA
jgi:hypothetical protein